MTMADADGDGQKELLVGSDDFEVIASTSCWVQRVLICHLSLSCYHFMGFENNDKKLVAVPIGVQSGQN